MTVTMIILYPLIQFLLSSTTAAPTSSEGSDCVAFANLYPGSQSIITDPIPGVWEQATCEARCRLDPTCFSYQINTNPGQTYCWHQQHEEFLDPNEMADQLNVVEYIKTNCARPLCVAFANLYPASQSINTVQIPGVWEQTICEARCRVDPTCFSYQINTNPGQTYCWHQQHKEYLDPNEMFYQPNVVEYIKTNCTVSAARTSPLSLPVSTSSTKASSTASVAMSSLTSLQALRTTPHGLPVPSSSEAARTTPLGLPMSTSLQVMSTSLQAVRTTPKGIQETTPSKAARTTPHGLPLSTPSKDTNMALP